MFEIGHMKSGSRGSIYTIYTGVLWRLTYETHGDSGKDGTVDLQAGILRERLAGIHPEHDRGRGWDWAESVLRLMRDRGGLLVAAACRPSPVPTSTRSAASYW